MIMQKRALKISLLLIALAISIVIPIINVIAKKPVWVSGPVYINDAIPGYTWEDWSTQPWLKGSGTEEDPYMIKDLVIDVSGSVFAMLIENSEVYFKIMHCTFRNAGIEGERTAGLLLIQTTNGIVFKNTFCGNMAGIALIGTHHNMVQKNLCSENEIGIFLQWSMFDTLKQNDCKNNFGSGIVLSTAHKTIIEKNECIENGVAGITLINEQVDDPEGEHDPKDNLLYKNKLMNNEFGIYLANADINDIFQNTISGNSYGVFLNSGCENNLLYHNNFIDNVFQAVDVQPSMNNWYHLYMEEGNYWSDYMGVDENEDGIGDTPMGYDGYPLLEKNGWDFYTPIEEEILNAFFNNINRLGADRTVNGSETSYVIYGVLQLFSERINGEAYPPYAMKINEMDVVDSVWYFDEDGFFYGEPGLMQLYYLKLPPNYLYDEMGLTPGYWEYSVELSWYNSGELQSIYFITGFTLI